MRITNQYIFDNFQDNHSKVLDQLNRLTTQISSGNKIEHSYENSAVYSDVLRFNSELNELNVTKQRATSAKEFADASDSALSEFNTTLTDFHTKLILASNGTQNSDNLKAIASELEGMKEHMISVANTQINGQYLFSGTALNTKPIDDQGKYRGNDKEIDILVGDGVKIKGNIDGKSLFLGEDLKIHKRLETNVVLENRATKEELSSDTPIKDIVEKDFNDSVTFYLSGIKRDGKAFKDKFEIKPEEKISDLLTKIESDFDGEVKVELTKNHTIAISDKKSGYSQVDFKLVGVKGSSTEDKLENIDNSKIVKFIKSDFKKVDDSKSESLQIDKEFFKKSGGVLKGNVQLLSSGKFATNATKLEDIANGSLDGKKFKMNIVDIDGNKKDVELELSNESKIKIDGKSFSLYNADGTKTKSSDITVSELNNVISLALSNVLKDKNSFSDEQDFQDSIKKARDVVDVNLNENANLEIVDKSHDISKIEFALYDEDANDFSKRDTPTISFNSNNALTVKKANINFFEELDEIIDSVKSAITTIGSNEDKPRSLSITSAIDKLSQFSSHFNSKQALIGTRSNSLQIAIDKASTLEVNVHELKSQSTEVDIAQTVMKLNQTTLSYQAMLKTISKVNSLTLLNYIK